ncbi:N-acetylmuramoyl-L-alanine amidase [Aureibaculum sp. 2210JD6-5]|uniref:N-acetylmuramoyl-L-alanine amidase family protein n=1 Tax=Aureibaculum sp. 2210JD6-5 TaxID=3103957 RepID=UPI002AAC5DA6|nr:N-acetylmuramoyl-L-alanine amidase [Aureibaculum sp. 2210JD6-5]MDY7396743.1 N-acetylmuramoyl-L-alanine amidase [Aureibaculum sp. 2210JD6-5]
MKICLVFGQNDASKKVIVIDPGHGGIDPGATGVNGVLEKDVVLNIAKELIRLNETLFEGNFDIYLTRYTDTLISLGDRAKLAKTLKADVFVSLHCNASQVFSKGMEVYVHHSNKLYTKSSIAFGLSVLNESTEKLGFKKRGGKFANFQVLRETVDFCPSILIETGFVTNTDEASYVKKPKNIRAIALAILMGLYNYLNMDDERIFN